MEEGSGAAECGSEAARWAKALSSILYLKTLCCEIRRRAGDVWAKKKSGGERSVAKEEGARCEGRCEGVEGMQ